MVAIATGDAHKLATPSSSTDNLAASNHATINLAAVNLAAVNLAKKVAGFAVLLALVVVLLGGWTRLSDAGLGCPDWPGCYGEWILPSDHQALSAAQQRFPEQALEAHKGWIEMIHRYFAGTLGLVILGLAVFAFKNRKVEDYPVKLSFFLLALVILQAAFGMWTVTLKLLPQVVTLHLLGGLTTLALLIRLRQRLVGLFEHKPPFYGKPLVMVGILLLFMQIALGGWTSSNYAGWSCTAWFDCAAQITVPLDYKNGFDVTHEIGPNYQGGLLEAPARAAIQVGHRFGAMISSVYIILMGILLIRHRSLRMPVAVTFVLLISQVALGILNIAFALPLHLAFAHHAGAVALLLSLLWLYQRAERRPQED